MLLCSLRRKEAKEKTEADAAAAETEAKKTAAAATGEVVVDEKLLKLLMEMGFTEKKSRIALSKSDNKQEQAFEYALAHADDEDPDDVNDPPKTAETTTTGATTTTTTAAAATHVFTAAAV